MDVKVTVGGPPPPGVVPGRDPYTVYCNEAMAAEVRATFPKMVPKSWTCPVCQEEKFGFDHVAQEKHISECRLNLKFTLRDEARREVEAMKAEMIKELRAEMMAQMKEGRDESRPVDERRNKKVRPRTKN